MSRNWQNLKQHLINLDEQENAYPQSWSILQAISNREQEGLIDPLKHSGDKEEVEKLSVVLSMTEFDTLSEVFPEFMSSKRIEMLEDLTSSGVQITPEDEQLIINNSKLEVGTNERQREKV